MSFNIRRSSGLHRLLVTHSDWARWAAYVALISILLIGPWLVFAYSYFDTPLRRGANEALQVDVALTDIERDLARQILIPSLIVERDLPVWRPPTEGAFGVANGPDRGGVDLAIDKVLEVRNAVLRGEATDQSFEAALRALNAAGDGLVQREEGLRDERGVILYHRAVLDIWRANRNTEDLEALEQAIARLNRRRGASPETRARARGADVARLYLQGRMERLNVAVGDERQAYSEAAKKFSEALEAAERFDQSVGPALSPRAQGQFRIFRSADHVVDLNTATIYNDLVVSLAQAGDTNAAIARVEELMRQPAALRAHAVLRSNVLAIHLVQGRQRDIATLRQSLDETTFGFVNPQLRALNRQADLRAGAMRVIVGLPLRGPETDVAGPERAAYERTQAGDTADRFPRLEFGQDPQRVANLLDEFLYFRHWRGQLSAGDVGGFLLDYRNLERGGGISMQDFASWRREALITLESDLRPVAYPNEGVVDGRDRDQALAVLSQPEFGWWTRARATAERAFPARLKWILVGAQAAFLLVVIFCFWVVPHYKRLFASQHGAARTRAAKRPRRSRRRKRTLQLEAPPHTGAT